MTDERLAERVTNGLAAVEAAVRAERLPASAAVNLRRWLTEPAYGEYSEAILKLVEAHEFATLDRYFWEEIPFGTGGRRGLMSDFGSATINARTIGESANGLAVYVKRALGEQERKAVIACDTRIRSEEFARLTARVLAAHGFHVYFFESHRATPELSFAVRHLGCDTGVMISASHNPPSDNGFKAYWSNGAQVLPPHDKGIIECVYQTKDIPLVDFDAAVRDGHIEIIGEQVDRAYLQAVCALSLSGERDIPALFTPLHGVGETSVYRVLRQAGFAGVTLFEPHRQPDGNFPNVPDHLPNPERPQVFAPLLEPARQHEISLLLASDPDADRLGVAVRGKAGEFVYLTGNQVGALITDYVLGKRKTAGTLSPRHFVVETMVTTPLIAEIGRAYGVRVIDDLLVGFKYIAAAMDANGPERFVFGAEESLGYLAGHYCRDKDAAVGALYILELAAERRRDGQSLLDRLDELYSRHGYFLEDQRSKTCVGSQGSEQIQQIMRAFRESPPGEFAGIPLARMRDYSQHEIRRLPDNSILEPLPEPSGNVLLIDSAPSDCQVTIAVRPSGTEPKIKFYFFARSAAAPAGQLTELKTRTRRRLTEVQDALSAWVDQVIRG